MVCQIFDVLNIYLLPYLSDPMIYLRHHRVITPAPFRVATPGLGTPARSNRNRTWQRYNLIFDQSRFGNDVASWLMCTPQVTQSSRPRAPESKAVDLIPLSCKVSSCRVNVKRKIDLPRALILTDKSGDLAHKNSAGILMLIITHRVTNQTLTWLTYPLRKLSRWTHYFASNRFRDHSRW